VHSWRKIKVLRFAAVPPADSELGIQSGFRKPPIDRIDI